jgi:hypothetical protein
LHEVEVVETKIPKIIEPLFAFTIQKKRFFFC